MRETSKKSLDRDHDRDRDRDRDCDCDCDRDHDRDRDRHRAVTVTVTETVVCDPTLTEMSSLFKSKRGIWGINLIFDFGLPVARLRGKICFI